MTYEPGEYLYGVMSRRTNAPNQWRTESPNVKAKFAKTEELLAQQGRIVLVEAMNRIIRERRNDGS